MMPGTRRLLLGIVVFVGAAAAASAQQPKRQPSLPPLPKARVTPAPQPPDTLPPTEQKSKTLVLVPIRTPPAKKASTSPAKKASRATADKKPVEEPTAAASGVTAESPPPPPSPVTSPKAAPAVDLALKAAMDKKLADATQRKTSVGSWILLGFGGLALIGLAVHFVRSRKADMLPPIFPDR